MCGLAGIIAWDERLAPTREVLSAMAARLAHRGPDYTGVWLSEASGEPSDSVSRCGLAHCRLSILDLNPRAHQPMHDPGGRVHLVFNGEIYNFRELRQELTGLLGDFVWQTTSDTEVILAAWRAWGRNCVDHFNGMFAIALWDQGKQVLFLTRDRMGQKPLFVGIRRQGDATGAAAFVSELGALAPVPWLTREVDLRAIADYFAWGYIPAPRTVYRDVISLPPGHCMEISAGKVQTWRYFDPNAAGRIESAAGGLAGEAPADTTRRLLCQAVKRQLVSDVPLGCFLSGGIDSSCLVAAMRQAMPDGQPVKTFTIAFDDAQYDESAYANRVALHLGTQHEKFTVRFDAAEDLPRLARAFGEPFADSSALPTHILSRLTRTGVKVALSGDGGDELFGGYDRYRAMAMHGRLPRWATAVLGWRMWQCLPGSHPKSKAARFKRFAESANQDAAARYAGYMRLFSVSQCRELMGAELAGYFPEAGGDQERVDEDVRGPGGSLHSAEAYLPDLFNKLSEGRDDVATAMAVDRVSYLPEDLLTKVDRCSMQHALEVRCPFMDHELVAFAAGLPGSLLLHGGTKRLLRDAFSRDLPEGLFDRPKMGFALPIGQWLRTCLKPMLMDHLGSGDSFASRYLRPGAVDRLIREHDSRTVDHSQRLYALLMLELWWATLK